MSAGIATVAIGPHAVLARVDDAVEAAILAAAIRATGPSPTDRPEGWATAPPMPLDVVPGARSVLLDGLPQSDANAWVRFLTGLDRESLRRWGNPHSAGADDLVATLSVTYDGPDLEAVATAWGCATDEVIQRHTTTRFRVAFCGFVPGFAYCLGEPPLPPVPRLGTPRERVAAGSVALGGEFCGVYPRASPGGWHIIGGTTANLFDAAAPTPARLAPGTTVRFERA